MNLEQYIEQLVVRVVRAELERAQAARELRFLTVEQAADRLAMSVTFIRDAIRDGRLPATKLGRSVRIAIADVDALASSARRRSSSAPESPRDRAARIKICGAR